MKKKESSVNIYRNGIAVRVHNKKVLMVDTEEGMIVDVRSFKKSDKEGVTCSHEMLRGNLQKTAVHYTTETLELITKAYLAYREHKSIKP